MIRRLLTRRSQLNDHVNIGGKNLASLAKV
jgi:hypothetical protein